MTAQLAEIPDDILRYLTRNANRSYTRSQNHYWVTDICKCLRQSYYQISGTPEDPKPNTENSVEGLWAMQSGKLLHGLTYAYSWRELEIEKKIILADMAEQVILRGRLDMYDHRSETLIDLKTTTSVRWQYNSGMLPRKSDVDQIQSYGTLFGEKIRISSLMLLYADLKEIIPLYISEINKAKWIEERLQQLHISLTITKLSPPAEYSTACQYCKFAKRCKIDGDLGSL